MNPKKRIRSSNQLNYKHHEKDIILSSCFFTVVITSITSCNSAEDIVIEPIQAPQNAELTKLYYSIDSLQKVYSIPESRVDWDKWGRRGLSFAVDGVVGLLFAETGPLAAPIAAVGSGLYEDYLDYMVARCNTRNGQIRPITRGESSSIKTGQAESTVHMLNWAIRSVKFLGVEFDQSEDEEVSVSDTTHL